MMMVLRDLYSVELVNINKELATLWEKGNSLTQNSLLEFKDKELPSHMEKFNKELISKKCENLKNKMAFLQGRAYT